MSAETRRTLDACWDAVLGDPGVASASDALVQLAWMLVLKHADDLERENEALAVLRDEPHEPIVPAPYRWRDWARALPGDGLAFLAHGNRDTRRSLFAELGDLAGTGGVRREAVARVLGAARCTLTERARFERVARALDGLDLAREGTLAETVRWYEERLADARRDAGALPSLGSVPELLARLVRPAPGETVLDLEFGDAGCLLAASEAAGGRVKLAGSEDDADLFVLGAARLVLRGVDTRELFPEDALAVQATELGDEDRADVVVGALRPERASVSPDVAAGFPLEQRASDPALLYLQLAVRRLRRPRKGRADDIGGRAAIVLPDRALSGGGRGAVGARVRRSLLELARLRAVVHLPARRAAERGGTSVLVLDHGGRADAVWFYEVAPDEPLERVLEWWRAPVERPGATRVPVDALVVEEDGELVACDLDRRPVRDPAPEPAPEAEEVAEPVHAGADLPEVRADVPPLIERPELQSLGRSALFASLTGLAWGVWAYLWLPAITLVAWIFGVELFRGEVGLVDPEPYLVFLGWWGVTVGVVLVLILLWAAYNIVRYGGDRNRRRSSPPLALEDVADGFGVPPERVAELRRARIVRLDVDAPGEAVVRL